MKNVMIALLLLCSFSLAAQGKHRGFHGKKMAQTNLSVEQQAILQSKRMTLLLDLSSDQRQHLERILIDQIGSKKEMQARRKVMRDSAVAPDPEQRFEYLNALLEEQIAFQNQMKGILSEEQYGIWKKANLAKHRGKRHPAVIR
ncbi:hypothetical protein ACT6NV_09120 [Robiginitalea sp. IMCC44478]|uniref:hypothetical protein n=1 Tax=Robiginitalea sp. IMCC44478 TaxID=3459122 RepID=UPI00404237F8